MCLPSVFILVFALLCAAARVLPLCLPDAPCVDPSAQIESESERARVREKEREGRREGDGEREGGREREGE